MLAIMVINQCVLMMNLIILLTHTQCEDAVCNFINSMLEENKYSGDVMKKYFNKELVKITKDDSDFENPPK